MKIYMLRSTPCWTERFNSEHDFSIRSRIRNTFSNTNTSIRANTDTFASHIQQAKLTSTTPVRRSHTVSGARYKAFPSTISSPLVKCLLRPTARSAPVVKATTMTSTSSSATSYSIIVTNSETSSEIIIDRYSPSSISATTTMFGRVMMTLSKSIRESGSNANCDSAVTGENVSSQKAMRETLSRLSSRKKSQGKHSRRVGPEDLSGGRSPAACSDDDEGWDYT